MYAECAIAAPSTSFVPEAVAFVDEGYRYYQGVRRARSVHADARRAALGRSHCSDPWNASAGATWRRCGRARTRVGAGSILNHSFCRVVDAKRSALLVRLQAGRAGCRRQTYNVRQERAEVTASDHDDPLRETVRPRQLGPVVGRCTRRTSDHRGRGHVRSARDLQEVCQHSGSLRAHSGSAPRNVGVAAVVVERRRAGQIEAAGARGPGGAAMAGDCQ